MPVIDINQGFYRITVTANDRTLLSILHENDIFIPSACGGKGQCGYCRVKVVSGGGPITDLEKDRLKPDDLAKGMRLSCQILVEADIAIEIPPQRFKSKRFSAKVAYKRLLSPSMLHLRLTFVSPPEMHFIAGQYIQLDSKPYNGIPTVTRAYSLASTPSDKTGIELIMKRVPNGTCSLWAFDHLREGDEVSLTGPYGNFRLSNSNAPILFVAGGSGLAPIRSLLIDMKERGVARTSYFFFGMPSEGDLVLTDELSALGTELPEFYFVPVIMQPKNPETWKGDTGTPLDAVERRFSDLSAHEAYVCGPAGLIEACVKRFTARGMREANIFYDKY